MSSLSPVRDDRSAPRDLSVSSHVCHSMANHKGARDLALALIYRRAATTRFQPRPGRSLRRRCSRRKELHRLRPTALRRRRQAVALCACKPLRLSRPWQWTTLGLALPLRASRLFHVPSDFSSSTLGSRSAHASILHEARFGARRMRSLSPISTSRLATRCVAVRQRLAAHSRGASSLAPQDCYAKCPSAGELHVFCGLSTPCLPPCLAITVAPAPSV